MKKFILVVCLLAATSCQKKKIQQTDLGPILGRIAVLEQTLDSYIMSFNALEAQEQALELAVAQLDLTITNLTASYMALLSQVEADEDLIATLRVDLDALILQVDSLDATNQTLVTQQSTMQTSINSALTQIAILNGYSNIVSMIDPCLDHPSKIDEVLLKLSDGKILASFSDNVNGLNTRFSVLGNGSYGTTDGTGCAFTVNNGVVTW